MSINKLIVLGAAFILASLIGSTPAAAQTTNPCDPSTYDATLCDSDSDGVVDAVDQCPNTDASTDLVVGACTIPNLNIVFTTGLDAGCSVADLLDECEVAATNHGRYVSCVAHLTNRLKKAGDISGKEKGKIQSCAARSDIGKPPHP